MHVQDGSETGEALKWERDATTPPTVLDQLTPVLYMHCSAAQSVVMRTNSLKLVVVPLTAPIRKYRSFFQLVSFFVLTFR